MESAHSSYGRMQFPCLAHPPRGWGRRCRSGKSGEHCALMCEELDLGVDAPAESGQVAVGADDAVAGDDEWYRVDVVCPPNRSGLCRITKLRCDLSVTSCLTVGYGPERVPDLHFPFRSGIGERDVECRSCVGGVFADLVHNGFACHRIPPHFEPTRIGAGEGRFGCSVSKCNPDDLSTFIERNVERTSR